MRLNGAPDWFLDIFTAEAEKLVEQLTTIASRKLGLENYWWVSGLPEPADERVLVAAVDGGGGLQPLSGGGAIYVARAFGNIPNAEPVRELELRIYPVRESYILDALRTWVEHRVAVRCITRLKQGSALLMDGSFWAIVVASVKRIIKTALSRNIGLGLAYASLIGAYVIVEIMELVRVAKSNGIILAYVSKDHSYKVLKELVLANYIASRAYNVGHVIRKAIEWYPITDRDLLISLRRSVDPGMRVFYDSLLDSNYRDTAFIIDHVGVDTGFTQPLRHPPPRYLREALLKPSIQEVIEKLCTRIEAVLGERDAEECWGIQQRLTSSLEQMPSVFSMYVKLGLEDTPILVELPIGHEWFFAPGRKFIPLNNMYESLVSVLVRDYAGPDYYNLPLVSAHINASLSSRQLSSYMALLEALASTRGVTLSFARRTSMKGKVKIR